MLVKIQFFLTLSFRDMFVPPDMRPKIKQMTESYLDEIFLFGKGTVVSKIHCFVANQHFYCTDYFK